MTPSPDEVDQTILSLEAGELLSGRYRLVRELGRGGMGIVWLAEDTSLQEQVALKLLPTVLSRDKRAVGRLKDEARRNLQLSHPHILRLINFEQDQTRGGLAYLVMQYVDGQTLNDLLAEHSDGLPLHRVQKWAEQVAAALDYAHEKGVLHRDIKPSNIMIDGDDNALLMDFGIAREAKDSYTRVTGRDSSGTLPYMSPQQLMGKNSRSNDIYSLAATLYEVIGGEPPFATGDLVEQIKHSVPEPVGGQPKHVNDALLAGLAKETEARPPSAAALAQAIVGQRKLPPTSTSRASSRRRAPLLAASLLVFIATAISLSIWQPWNQSAPNESTTARQPVPTNTTLQIKEQPSSSHAPPAETTEAPSEDAPHDDDDDDAAGEHGDAVEFSAPQTYPHAVEAIHAQLEKIEALIATRRLDHVHAEAAVVRDIANGIGRLALKDGSSVPREAVREINLAAKDLAAKFGPIDEAGDSGDLAGTQTIYDEMIALYETLKKYAPDDDDGDDHAEGGHGEPIEFSAPQTYAHAVEAIHAQLEKIEKLIATGGLDRVHAEAAVIRDIANGIGRLALKDGSGVPREAVRQINLAAKDLAAKFGPIDEAGDSGDLAGTQTIYDEMIALYETLEKHAPAEPDHDDNH